MTQPEEFYCTYCGGTDITAEAYCYWDNVQQKFARYHKTEEGYDHCATCEDQAQSAFRPITDVKTLAQIAINQNDKELTT